LKHSRDRFPSEWSITSYLANQKNRVESRLAQLPLRSGKTTKAKQAMRYAIDSPGKRFRPLLLISTADIYQRGHSDIVLDAAVAVECIHTASLVFDDLPSMDDASLRRGRETTHRLYGEEQAILAGMSLIAEANMLLAAHTKDRKMQRKKLECLFLLNESFSIEGLSGGQSDDLLKKPDLNFQELEYIHAKKTGSLFVACTELAAVLCDANEMERSCLVSFSKNLGLAFQIQDDLLDEVDSSEIGKDQGQDLDKTTFLTIFGREKCVALYEDLIDVALKNLQPFGSSAAHLVELTQIIRARKK
jgi:geranylgeranyl diphosphate synthase type II